MKRTAPSLPVRERSGFEAEEKALSSAGVDPLFAKLFAARGVKNKKEITYPGPGLLSWKNLKNIEKAASLVADKIASREKIVIVADYDADGATSCAILLLGLKKMGAQAAFAVPNRFKHGYGLTAGVTQEVADKLAPRLIITVDNGISSHDGIDVANRLGIQTVVTDHHLAPKVLPAASAIVNPNQPGCQFESKNLAGCGVAFYLLAAVKEELKKRGDAKSAAVNLMEYLDFAAIGTIADVVRLDQNNRVIAWLGLERIRNGLAHPGVAALFAVARRNMQMATSKDIGFAVGPRINAAGRLEDMATGIKCLIAEDFQEGLEWALKLDDLNAERKEIESGMQDGAEDLMALGANGAPKNSITVLGKGFHEGVIGIVAGRIKEREHRPTIVFAPAQEAGWIKGSGRSIPGFNMKDALDAISKKHPDVLKKFGGHAMAAGMSIKAEDFPLFQAAFEEEAHLGLTPEALERAMWTDGDIPAEWITQESAGALGRQVWGQGFPEPLFVSRFTVVSQRLIKESHLKLEVEKEGKMFGAIWFFKHELLQAREIEMVYSVELSEFRGERGAQLMVAQATELQ